MIHHTPCFTYIYLWSIQGYCPFLGPFRNILMSPLRLNPLQSLIIEFLFFHPVTKFWNKIIKFNVDVIYAYFEQDGSKKRTVWDSTHDWCPIGDCAIDNSPLFSITQPVLDSVVNITIDSKLLTLNITYYVEFYQMPFWKSRHTTSNDHGHRRDIMA